MPLATRTHWRAAVSAADYRKGVSPKRPTMRRFRQRKMILIVFAIFALIQIAAADWQVVSASDEGSVVKGNGRAHRRTGSIDGEIQTLNPITTKTQRHNGNTVQFPQTAATGFKVRHREKPKSPEPNLSNPTTVARVSLPAFSYSCVSAQTCYLRFFVSFVPLW